MEGENKKTVKKNKAGAQKEDGAFDEGLKVEAREEKKIEKLEEAREALLNMLEDTEDAKKRAVEEKNKTLAIVINFVDGLILLDSRNKIDLINPRAEQFFNIKAKEVKGKLFSKLSDISDFKLLIDVLAKEPIEIFRKELKIAEDLILEVTMLPIAREASASEKLIILHDITREKRVEQMKTEFVSIAAHQLRTPLSAIKWTLKMLLDGDLGQINEEQKSFIGRTYWSNERMIALINDLLNVTRIEEGRYLYSPVLTDIGAIVQSTSDFLKEEIERRKIKFKFEKPKEKLPKVLVDVEKIKLVVQNLLENAIRYTKPGGEVIVSVRGDKEKVSFQIKDTGVGIQKSQQDRIFTKFFRGENVIRMETDGSGLGLFIAKNIVNSHGGKIWFESKKNQGATFYFTLPVGRELEEFAKGF